MKKFNILLFLLTTLLLSNECLGQELSADKKYIFKRGDFNGIGKWYMGREIAYVMGFEGIGWLERLDREKEENVSTLIKNMKIRFKKQMSECVRYVRATYIIIQKETCHAAMSRWVAGGLADPRAEMFRREGSLTGPFPKPA